ncbi:MAG: hypothetical protein KF850_40160 [Labilithrix sp.]|nr:hypothetical protein [Labilithrix sp.]MBX3218289.1 hypothetical protein [Labilithrix sp.]
MAATSEQPTAAGSPTSGGGAPTAPTPTESSPSQQTQGGGCRVVHIGCLNYGVSFSLLRIRAERRSDEPARERNYDVKMEGVPVEFGFHFTYGPPSTPWRIGPKAKPFQLFTVGGMLLVGINRESDYRGNFSLGAIIGAFENAIILGVGMDLYRGIAVRGPSGPGTETIPTGPIGWAVSRRGEVTAENVFFVVTANIGDVLKRLSGSSEE